MKPNDDLQRLRGLLLHDEQKELEQLKRRISNRIQRTNDVSSVLPDSLTLSGKTNPEALADSLSDSVERSIYKSVRENPQQFADVLYPSILPAISRSISEAFRQLQEQIDTTLKQKFSARSIGWRLEAWRTGTPLSQIVLRESSPFTVDQVLLIQYGSGLLIEHRYQEGIKGVDSDAVSGMLWAIESFVRDSFSNEREGLNRVTTESHILYLIHGKAAMLVCVVKGVAPEGFLMQARNTLARLHIQHGEILEKFNGDHQGLAVARKHMDPLLQMDHDDLAEKSQIVEKVKRPVIYAILPFLLLLAFAGWRFYDSKRIESLVETLNDEPGITVFSFKRNDGRWLLQGLADPAAKDPQDILQAENLNPENYQLDFKPYLSLEQEIATTRLRKDLNIPKTISLSIVQGEALLAGKGAPSWYQAFKQRQHLPAGVTRLDHSEVVLSPDEVVAHLKRTLVPPDSVKVSVKQGRVQLEGNATSEWISQLEQYIADFGDKIKFDMF